MLPDVHQNYINQITEDAEKSLRKEHSVKKPKLQPVPIPGIMSLEVSRIDKKTTNSKSVQNNNKLGKAHYQQKADII